MSGRRSFTTAIQHAAPLVAIIAIAFALDVWGISYGLPASHRAWDHDEIVPNHVVSTLRSGFVGSSWPVKYPPFHFYLLMLPYTAVLRLVAAGHIVLDAQGVTTLLFYVSRSISVLMSVGTVVFVYLAGREAMDRRGALLAALVSALSLPVVFYAKHGNLDAPYVFWFALSLWLYFRILSRHRLFDYIGFGLAGAMAIGTKDQAYALYVLSPLPILWSLARHERREGRYPGVLRLCFDRRILACGAAVILLFLAGHQVFNNPLILVRHVDRITGPYSADYRFFEQSVRGHLQSLALSGHNLVFSFGWPATAAAIAGFVTAWRARREPATILLAAALVLVVGYQAAFIEVILYQYDRFFMPTCLVLSLFAGHALSRLLAADGIPRPVRTAVVGLVLGLSGLRAGTLDLLIHNDSRYQLEAWLEARSGGSHLLLGDSRRGPRIRALEFNRQLLAPQGERSIAAIRPRFIVVNVTDIGNNSFQRAGGAVYDALLTGENGYRLRFHQRYELPGFLRSLIDFTGTTGSLFFINPELAVFERRPDLWPRRLAALAGWAADTDADHAALVAAGIATGSDGVTGEADEFGARDCPDTVEAILRLAAFREPGSPAAAVALARFLLQAGQLDGAWEEATAAGRLAPGAAEIQLLRGQIAARRGDRTAGFRALTEAMELARSSADVVALEEIAWQFYALGAREHSLRAMRFAIDVDGGQLGETLPGEFARLLRLVDRTTEANWLLASLAAGHP